MEKLNCTILCFWSLSQKILQHPHLNTSCGSARAFGTEHKEKKTERHLFTQKIHKYPSELF